MSKLEDRIRVYLNADGAEAVAKGVDLYTWHFTIGQYEDPPTSAVQLIAEVKLPEFDKDLCVRRAVAALQERKASVYEAANREAREMDERIQNLLALPAPDTPATVTVVEPLDDIPF